MSRQIPRVDITQEIAEWQGAVYGEEVRDANVQALTKLQTQMNAACDEFEDIAEDFDERDEQWEEDMESVAESVTAAAGSATAAAGSKSDSEAYAVGKRNGTDVGTTDPAWHNNAKYYAESAGNDAEAAAGSAEAAGEAQTAAETAQEAAEDAARRASEIVDIDIATTSKAGIVKATDDVAVASDGKMSTPNVVHVDRSMSFTSAQKEQALANIGALGRSVFDNFLLYMHNNCPRFKDITSYYRDGTLWKRLQGTDGFSLFEDIFVGDYFQMSRPISAYERTGQYQATGSDWVTIAGIDSLAGNGDNIDMSYHHLVMVPGKGDGGTQHFGRSRMNSSHTTAGGYKNSEMNTTTIGAVTSSGATGAQATINQQLYAEFGSHLKTTRELITNAVNSAYYNRCGQASGAASAWEWASMQAILMSEIEVYGSEVWSSSGYDTGNAWPQLPLFRLSKKAANNRSSYYWLKSVSSASSFCYVYGIGNAGDTGAGSANRYVRPRFVLGA